MGSSPDRPSRLGAFQVGVLQAFFRRESGFFLTGGGALAGFHLGHRETSDLDLFTTDDAAFERGRHALADLAVELGADLEVRQDAPGFRRFVLSRGEDTLIVDLVRERSFQLHETKEHRDGILVDPADEILANKLTAIVGRARAGLRVEDALAAAQEKDGGCTPATLAWLLSEVVIPDGTALPAAVPPGELRDWLAGLIKRLRRRALP
jgi:hypothetical protein